MPKISAFLGIIITMYHRDHAPPHFHAKYNEYTGAFSIQDLKLIEGNMPKRIIALILEWAYEHREELNENWKLAVNKKTLKKIDPLI